MNTDTADVVVIGGGPAGSSAAGFLAKHGRRVILIEREQFPRHHVGESTLQGLFGMLDDELGAGEVLKKVGFRVKTGGTFIWGNDRRHGHSISLTAEILIGSTGWHSRSNGRFRSTSS